MSIAATIGLVLLALVLVVVAAVIAAVGYSCSVNP